MGDFETVPIYGEHVKTILEVINSLGFWKAHTIFSHQIIIENEDLEDK